MCLSSPHGKRYCRKDTVLFLIKVDDVRINATIDFRGIDQCQDFVSLQWNTRSTNVLEYCGVDSSELRLPNGVDNSTRQATFRERDVLFCRQYLGDDVGDVAPTAQCDIIADANHGTFDDRCCIEKDQSLRSRRLCALLAGQRVLLLSGGSFGILEENLIKHLLGTSLHAL